eukprot:CAMPEP_0204538226 /NCGR_PEP_ID=MMETSP0661-20131031/15839_1 /ASSEMBLY_ACC=CAM_ASM_000606 /TAXON_ID=109239 /ORGANISM="Alexandrium margalefi, Strain AMGDE01CS-322" /LENGTH=185 /DNA_ID=CAMNT_0051544807 /DNA_START=52 /DNA_END=605 /DNA_ORIENTATION=+
MHACPSREARRSEVEVLGDVAVRADALREVHELAHALDVLLHNRILVVLEQLVLISLVRPASLILANGTCIRRVGLVPLLVAQGHVDVGGAGLGVLPVGGERHHLVQLPDDLVVRLAPLQLLDERRHRALDLLERTPAPENRQLGLLQVPAIKGQGALQLPPPRADREAGKVLHELRGRSGLLPR